MRGGKSFLDGSLLAANLKISDINYVKTGKDILQKLLYLDYIDGIVMSNLEYKMEQSFWDKQLKKLMENSEKEYYFLVVNNDFLKEFEEGKIIETVSTLLNAKNYLSKEFDSFEDNTIAKTNITDEMFNIAKENTFYYNFDENKDLYIKGNMMSLFKDILDEYNKTNKSSISENDIQKYMSELKKVFTGEKN